MFAENSENSEERAETDYALPHGYYFKAFLYTMQDSFIRVSFIFLTVAAEH